MYKDQGGGDHCIYWGFKCIFVYVWAALTPKVIKEGKWRPGGVVFGWCGPAEKGGRRRLAADLWTLMGSSRLNGIIAGATFPGLPQGLYSFSAATCRWRPRGPWWPSVCGIAPRHRHGLGVGTSRHLHGLCLGTSCGDYVNLGLGNTGVWGLFKLGGLCPGICFCLRAHVHEWRAHIWI